MSYIINVSRKPTTIGGRTFPPKHIFRTAANSILSRADAIAIAKRLAIIYPDHQYEINLSVDTTHSEYIDWQEETENA